MQNSRVGILSATLESRRICLAGLLLALAAALGTARAESECERHVGKAVSVQGRVEVLRVGVTGWRELTLGEPLCIGDSLRVAQRSRAAVMLANQTLFRLDADTSVTFSRVEPEAPSWLDLLKGALHFISRTPSSLKVRTPFVNAAIEGTEFSLRVDENETDILVFDGQVLFGNQIGQLTLTAGEAAVAKSGDAPVRQIVINPRDAVQWAIYYPAVVDYRTQAYPPGPDQAAILAAIDEYRRGDLSAAFAVLDAVPPADRSEGFHTLRAGLLLSVGQVDESRSDIEQALLINPNNGVAYAMRSVIALAQNRFDEALALAEEAAQLDPESAVPKTALSYAYQAKFDIARARAAADQAVELEPEDALAWARLSEMELSLGYLDRGLSAARQAESLDPDLARTQSALGFAQLTEMRVAEAETAFRKSIRLDPAAPLPRLGLGLAIIRRGALDEGVSEIEIAASLDPNNSLIRSYLGKAYYEQKRVSLASSEYRIARELDPLDPTSYFYDAILLQTTNRPVEALREIRKAVELNGNRAVYRSRLLLDQDLASRTANVARIYDDLGFQQRALLEGWQSVNLDPANHSGHRFLADTYAALPRHEVARASELLQAQLLQPINITPVQPRQAETNLLILSGAGLGNPSFNEFNPLFVRNRAALQASGVVGTESTLGDELILSGLYNNLSGSLGQFHFQTDGFGENSDFRNDVLNAFFQSAITPRHNIQGEIRRGKLDAGDTAQSVQTSTVNSNLRKDIDNTSYRIGYRFNPSPGSDIIASVIYGEQDETAEQQNESSDFPGLFLDQVTDLSASAFNAETQYLGHIGRMFNLTAGIGYYRTENDESDKITLIDAQSGFKIPLPPLEQQFDIQNISAYTYSQFRYPRRVTWTLGLGADFYTDDRTSEFDNSQVNPKLGIDWEVTDSTNLRLAAFRLLKQPLAVNQTIQPTQVAGFNQFFDFPNGTDVHRYGIGLDQEFHHDLLGGVELSRNELTIPTQLESQDPLSGNRFFEFINEDSQEWLARAYAYWTPTNRTAVSAEYYFEDISRDPNARFPIVNQPTLIRTHRLPLGLNYYHPSGVFTQWKLSFVDQDTEFQDIAGNVDPFDDQFWLLDAAIGYRMPNRSGIVSLVVKNLTDQSFDFQDPDISGNPRLPLFQPGRSILFNVSLSL